jgi:hypothetical protein
MISQGASELNISFVIQESDVPKAVQHLHAQFFPVSPNSISAQKKNGGSKRARANGRGSLTPRVRATRVSTEQGGEITVQLHS